jgi:integrase
MSDFFCFLVVANRCELGRSFLAACAGNRIGQAARDPHRDAPGELMGLKWEDVDLEAGALRVRRTLSHRNAVRAFKALLGHAELPETTRFYDLRHTCATLLLNSNVHPK